MESLKVINQLKEVKNYSKILFKHCVRSVTPRALVRQNLVVKDDTLIAGGRKYGLNQNCYIVGFGKAVLEMGREAEELLGVHLKKGILSVPVGTSEATTPPDTRLEVFQGAKYNLPDPNSEATAKKVVEMLGPTTEKELVLVLISGGGSALLPYPIPPITLQEKLGVIQGLASAGANIIELNAVRKKLSMTKGGKLAKLAAPSPVLALILSDVIGDPIGSIAGGPTAADLHSTAEVKEILTRYQVTDKLPQSVVDVLNNPEIAMDSSQLKHVHNIIIGNNDLALRTGAEVAAKDGHSAFVMTRKLQGDVETTAAALADLSILICKALSKTVTKEILHKEMAALSDTLRLNPESRDALIATVSGSANNLVLLFGGETTVRVQGTGSGGRNQELPLHFSQKLDALSKTTHITQLFNIVLFCGGTDGIDGPTDAAGAVGYLGLTGLAQSQQLDVDRHIKENNSYGFYSVFNSGEDHVITGHTGTNVMDIAILTIQSKT